MNKLLKNIANWPPLWNLLQDIVGANQWKLSMYPSVFVGKSGKLLDFACSQGNTVLAFVDFEYRGVDVDAEAIVTATERYARYPNIKFYCADILKESLPERDFDYVLFAAAGHHIPHENFKQTIDALLTYLKPGGTLHFFDLIRQPGIDGFTTRMLIRTDQGRFIRTKEKYAQIFSQYNVIDFKYFPSPSDWIIKQEDFVYYALSN